MCFGETVSVILWRNRLVISTVEWWIEVIIRFFHVLEREKKTEEERGWVTLPFQGIFAPRRNAVNGHPARTMPFIYLCLFISHLSDCGFQLSLSLTHTHTELLSCCYQLGFLSKRLPSNNSSITIYQRVNHFLV